MIMLLVELCLPNERHSGQKGLRRPRWACWKKLPSSVCFPKRSRPQGCSGQGRESVTSNTLFDPSPRPLRHLVAVERPGSPRSSFQTAFVSALNCTQRRRSRISGMAPVPHQRRACPPCDRALPVGLAAHAVSAPCLQNHVQQGCSSFISWRT